MAGCCACGTHSRQAQRLCACPKEQQQGGRQQAARARRRDGRAPSVLHRASICLGVGSPGCAKMAWLRSSSSWSRDRLAGTCWCGMAEGRRGAARAVQLPPPGARCADEPAAVREGMDRAVGCAPAEAATAAASQAVPWAVGGAEGGRPRVEASPRRTGGRGVAGPRCRREAGLRGGQGPGDCARADAGAVGELPALLRGSGWWIGFVCAFCLAGCERLGHEAHAASRGSCCDFWRLSIAQALLPTVLAALHRQMRHEQRPSPVPGLALSKGRSACACKHPETPRLEARAGMRTCVADETAP